MPFHGPGDTDRQARLAAEVRAVRLTLELRSVVAHLHLGAGKIDFDLAYVTSPEGGLHLQRLERRDRPRVDRELELRPVRQRRHARLATGITTRQRQDDIGFRVEQGRQLVADDAEDGESQQDGCIEQQVLGHQVGVACVVAVIDLGGSIIAERQGLPDRRADTGVERRRQVGATAIVRRSGLAKF